MKKLLTIILLVPYFCMGQKIIKKPANSGNVVLTIGMLGSVDTPIVRTITTDSIPYVIESGDWMPSGEPIIYPRLPNFGDLLYRHTQPEIKIDTIKVKALITTDKIKAPFEVELLWVTEKVNFEMTLAIYPPRVPLNKYLTLDKKELPKTTTIWISNPIN